MYGHSVKEPLRGGFITGDLIFMQKALVMGISFDTDPTGELGSGLICQGLCEMDDGGSKSGTSLSEGAL